VKPTQFKQLLLVSALALSLPSIAAENPATAGGQSAITTGNATATAGLTNPSGASASTDVSEPAPVANESVKDAVNECPLANTSQTAIAEAMRVASIKPDIDGMFNDKTEAAAGCFAASSKVINLAMEIPSVTLDWSNLGNLVKGNIERILQQKAEEVLNKGCAIADQALLGALEPVQAYMADYQNRVGEFNGLVGNLEMGAEYENNNKNVYANVLTMVDQKISGSEANIAAASSAMKNVDAAILQKYKDELSNTPFVPATNAASQANTQASQSASAVQSYSFDNGSSASTQSFTAAPTTTAPATVAATPTYQAPAASPTASSTNPYGASTSASGQF
jgi:hypothetical protein